MKWFPTLIGLALLMAAGTWFGGWPLVAVVAAGWGVGAAGRRTAVFTAALAAALAWGALLAYDASAGPLGRLVQLFGPMFHLPGGMIVVLTLAYAALLAASASALTRGIRRLMSPV
jgi:hypothetical protein